MNQFSQFIEKLRKRPEEERRLMAGSTMVVLSLLIVGVWAHSLKKQVASTIALSGSPVGETRDEIAPAEKGVPSPFETLTEGIVAFGRTSGAFLRGLKGASTGKIENFDESLSILEKEIGGEITKNEMGKREMGQEARPQLSSGGAGEIERKGETKKTGRRFGEVLQYNLGEIRKGFFELIGYIKRPF